jgi:uncharacterized membrane-anchored protein
MTNATLAFAAALLGWAPLVVLLSWRLRRTEGEIAELQARLSVTTEQGLDNLNDLCALASDMRRARAAVAELSANERTNALDICRIGDEHVETRGYVMGHTRALDAHDERLQVLEGRP